MDFNLPQTSEQKLQLMQYWYKWFFNRTSKWGPKLGTEISYLLGAIMNDTFIIVTSNSDIIQLIKKYNVSQKSIIWKYLKFLDN